MRNRIITLMLLLPLLISCEKPVNNYIIKPAERNPDSGQTDPGNTDPEPDVPAATSEGPVIVGYATYWDTTIPDPTFLTHINYSFAHIKDDFESLDIKTESRLVKIAALKQQKPGLKVLLSVGGWEAGNFSEMADDDTHRANFCKNCVAAVKKYNLDGIDLDWEYPTSDAAGISSSPYDTENYTLLAKELRAALGNDLLLTMASSATAKYYDFKSIEPYFNFFNLMTYDMGRPPQAHNGALYKGSLTSNSCDESVSKHKKAKVPYNKMVLGIPFYGKGNKTDFDLKGSGVDYRDIVWDSEKYFERWDETSKVPYLVNSAGTMVLSFENEQSAALKAQYIKQKGLLGAMYWNIEADDDSWTLSKALASELLGWQDQGAFLATNQYVEKYLEEVNYPNTNNPDTDKEYYNTLVKGYPGGGPSTNNIEIPPTYTIQWTASASAGALKLQVWEGSWSREYNLPAGTSSQGITNLVPGRKYQYLVTGSGNSVVAKGSFSTRGLLHQVFFEPNVRNGRDLGGWKGLGGKTVAYRKLFRGGVLKEKKEGQYLNDAGKAEMRAQGIKAELDLQEEGVAQSSSPIGTDITFFAPHFASGWNEMVARNPDKVKECFCWIVARLRENKPVYFHCWSGRDRTGTMAVLLLGTLGVSESDMAKDFELTYFSPKSWSMYQDLYQHTRDSYSYKSIRKTIFGKTDSGTYQERIVKYLMQIGVPEKDITDLRAIMLE